MTEIFGYFLWNSMYPPHSSDSIWDMKRYFSGFPPSMRSMRGSIHSAWDAVPVANMMGGSEASRYWCTGMAIIPTFCENW